MKRGISLTLSCCILFSLSICFYLDFLLIFLVPLWLFSFFDSYNLRNQTESQAASNPDIWLFGLSIADSEKFSAPFHRRNSIAGWVLVILGIYILFDPFVGRTMQVLCEYLGQRWLYDIVLRDLPRMVVTVFIIALGLWFIRGPKQPKAEDIPAFTPPTAEAENSCADAPTVPEAQVSHVEN